MQIQIILYILLLAYIFYILGNHVYKEYSSRRTLKHPNNYIRMLSDKERDYVTPYAKIHGFSLASNEVFLLEKATVSFEGYRVNGGAVLKVRANDIEMIFPYLLELTISDDDSNIIEYVILNNGKHPRIAIAVKLNDVGIIDIGRKVWDDRSNGKPLEKVLSTRDESPTEYRLRQKKTHYRWTFLWASLACVFLCIAVLVKTPLPLIIHLGIAAVFIAATLVAFFRNRMKNKPVQQVKRVDGLLSPINYRDLANANNMHIRPFIGINHPMADLDNAIIKDEVDLEKLDQVQAELRYHPQTRQYNVVASSFTQSIDTVYKNSSLRPNKLLLWASVLCVFFAIILYLCAPPTQRISALYSYALDYLPNRQITTHNNIFNLSNSTISRGDSIELSGNKGMDPEIIFLHNDKPKINYDALRLGADELLKLPKTPKSLKTLYDFDFFELRVRNKVIYPRSFTYKMRAEKRAQSSPSYQYLGNNPYIVFKANLITNPNKLFELLDNVCSQSQITSCDSLYQKIANGISRDENYYLNKMEDYYDKKLSVDELRTLFSADTIWLDESSYYGLKNDLQYWVSDLTANKFTPENFVNLTTRQGGVIFEGEGILSDTLTEHSYRKPTGLVAELSFFQNSPYQLSGLVNSIRTIDGIRHVDLLKRDSEISQQAFATLIAMAWIVVMFAVSFLFWLIPTKYPRVLKKEKSVENNSSPIIR